ncbi:PhoH family protein [Anaerocolumna xylanovorans]|uniref:PhoH-like ATPase n=1 Tax=Anaerocolumna xylanovorans DSM 12503 TaxID=1121345 RepID=A0A1M7YFK4_9FIRM|nr:PhoH family protein [Anaerocolumna xylanovorans]SHO51425.1 PhoH-like ATPase [Anaerocolumna xylanovorans DSM 12503]
MIKTYVLDTNVLIQSPYALLSFEENKVVLPIAVLEELDKLKNEESERGANARQSIRFLEQLRQTGNLFEGVALKTGGNLKIEANFIHVDLPFGFASDSNDNRILKVCKGLSEKGEAVILVTKDIIVRLKSQKIGITAEDFTTEQSPLLKEQYTGRTDVYAPDKAMNEFKKKGLSLDQIYLSADAEAFSHTEISSAVDMPPFKQKVQPVYNQFFIIHSETNEKKTLLGRFNGKLIVPLKNLKEEPFGVKPVNVGQKFLQEALMLEADTAPLVIVKGPAGTAKTFYSLAVGLEKIFNADKKSYRKILITRPNVQFDEDIGFLPGTEQEKIAPYLRPIIDNLEILVDKNENERYKNEKELRGKIDELFSRGIIMAEAMNFIRGRSITHTYLIIDEAQNLTPKQVKGIVTRVGKGTKVILLGDPGQIDHPLLDERTNGLSYASEKMKGSPLCYQVTMLTEECERSALALDAAQRM